MRVEMRGGEDLLPLPEIIYGTYLASDYSYKLQRKYWLSWSHVCPDLQYLSFWFTLTQLPRRTLINSQQTEGWRILHRNPQNTTYIYCLDLSVSWLDVEESVATTLVPIQRRRQHHSAINIVRLIKVANSSSTSSSHGTSSCLSDDYLPFWLPYCVIRTEGVVFILM